MAGGATFDAEKLLAWCGDKGFAVHLVELFLNQISTTLQSVLERLDAGDTAGVGLLAHRLKGAAGQLSADSIATVAHAMMESACTGDVAHERRLLEELRAEVASFVAAASLAFNHSYKVPLPTTRRGAVAHTCC